MSKIQVLDPITIDKIAAADMILFTTPVYWLSLIHI